MTATGNSELERTGSDVSRVCVAVPSTGHHQLDFDSVGHQDPQDLLVGDVLHTETHTEHCGHMTMQTHTCVLHLCVFVFYMVDEARLVSSCLSFPSRASPLFSLFLSSVGVRVYTLQKVELDDTWSLWRPDAAVRQTVQVNPAPPPISLNRCEHQWPFVTGFKPAQIG